MNKTKKLCVHQSRLVRRLSEMDVSDPSAAYGYFSEQFGQLVDLSGSIALAGILDELPAVPFIPNRVSSGEIKEAFIKERSAIVHTIITRFVPNQGYAGGKLPSPGEYHAHCRLTGVFTGSGAESVVDHAAAFEPYRKFYVKRQGELAAGVHGIHTRIGKSVSGLSPELARLSRLDSGLGQVLAGSSRAFFAKIPRLLGKRFEHQLTLHWRELADTPAASDIEKWMNPDGWIYRFCMEMREVLLAELDIRMQPVLGMIDALPKK